MKPKTASERHEHRGFGKARIPIVERLINNLTRRGRNTDKKALAYNIVNNVFEIRA